MAYLENIAKQGITWFAADDIPENTFTIEEKHQKIIQKERMCFNIHKQ